MTVVVLGVWISSAWYRIRATYPITVNSGTQSPIGAADISGGLLFVQWKSLWLRSRVTETYIERGSFRIEVGSVKCHWWRMSATTQAGGFFASIPLCYVCLLVLVPTVAAWRLDLLAARRARKGHCPACNYDLSSLPPGTLCPECGQAPDQAAATRKC